MRSLLLASFLFCTGLASAQEVLSAEAQDLQLAAVINLILPITVDYDVQQYKIVYTTVDAFGMPDTASGLLSLPLTDMDLAFPLAVYNHGTVGEREAVPSRSGTPERLLATAIAASGYATLSPDYIGLGDSDGIHPYVHAASEASAGRDMIVAVRDWLAGQEYAFTDQLFLTGYSQGGHATAALHRDIETNPGDDGLTVTSATHLSGPYSISDVMVGTLFTDELSTRPGYIAYTYVSYNFVYGLYDDLSEVFVEPYLAPTRQFAAEEISLDEYDAILVDLLAENDARLEEILQPAVVEVLRNGDPTAPINQALADNDTYDWAPVAPTLIFYCTEDDQVPFRNAILADSVMRANGATAVTLESGGPLSHTGCVIPASLATLEFWAELQEIVNSLGAPADRPDVTLAPNPAARGTELRLTGLPAGPLPYALYDAQGRLAAHGLTTSHGTLRPRQNMVPGIHMLRVGLPDGTSVVRRVVLQ